MQKKLTAAGLLLLLLAVLASCTVQTPQAHYSQSDSRQNKAGTASIRIDCSTVLQNMDQLDAAIAKSGVLPKDGIILQTTNYDFQQGDTVFDLLSRVAKEQKIQMEYKGAQDNSVGALYIESIGYLYEFSCGPHSGWSYRVNDEFPSVGCDSYALADGDTVQWLYTCDMGQDIGNSVAQ